jgi:hypothetical protein
MEKRVEQYIQFIQDLQLQRQQLEKEIERLRTNLVSFKSLPNHIKLSKISRLCW